MNRGKRLFSLRRKLCRISKFIQNNYRVMIPQVHRVQILTLLDITSCIKLCVIVEQ